MEQRPIGSRVIKTEAINWRELQFIQQENFKELDESSKHRLKASIVSNSFTQPFYVWEDPDGKLFCLDGKHRTILLEELLREGILVPYQLPATFIECRSRKEAAKLVLLFSSQYARVTQEGLNTFLTINDLDFTELKGEIDLPDFSEMRFEQNFMLLDVEQEDEEIIEVAETDVVVKPGDVFRVGKHLIICGDFNSGQVQEIIGNLPKARIVMTDPPYNLKANAFTNKGEVEHEDFAMAAGEMSDAEFVSFIDAIMQRSVQNTVDGSIHYYFMDWRHTWHMTEAGRNIYGSPIPKQLVVWNKSNGANGSFYRSKHELCFIFKSGEAKHFSNLDLKDRTRYNVWDYPNSTAFNNTEKAELKNHPTPKNLEMIADAIRDTTQEGDAVIDWFIGSGTTLIACELTGRICYCTDIEPKYVQSTILRYIKRCIREGVKPEIEHVNGPLTLDTFGLLCTPAA